MRSFTGEDSELSKELEITYGFQEKTNRHHAYAMHYNTFMFAIEDLVVRISEDLEEGGYKLCIKRCIQKLSQIYTWVLDYASIPQKFFSQGGSKYTIASY